MYDNNYIENISNFKSDLVEYFNSQEFLILTSSMTGDYFANNYLQDLINICTNGKCVRSYLVNLIYHLLGGKDENLIIKASASYELFEGSVLAHDDIIDKSEIRRSAPSLYVKLGNNHIGLSRAICVGDFGLIFANEIINQLNINYLIKQKAITHQTKVYLTTISGELLDVDISNRDSVLENDIIEMYKEKTANYTIAGPMELGAILANQNDRTLRLLHDIGLNLGVAFQIKDDILGVFSDTSVIGKSNTSDSAEGKKTILISHFDEVANSDDKSNFYSFYGTESAKDNIDTIKRLLEENNCLAYANQKLEEYYNNAITLIDDSNFDINIKQSLKAFANYILNRNK